MQLQESWQVEESEEDEFYEAWHEYPRDDWAGFKEDYFFNKIDQELHDNFTQIQLHPELAYFAHNWRNKIPIYTSHIQTTLEIWGFTSPNGPYQPWPPTEETPEIPLHWLAEQPQVAFELIRKSYFFSEAPIPSVLHTCVESRQVLLKLGYQLAFSTRSHGPRTWFHFGRDRLYLAETSPRAYYYPRHSCYHSWTCRVETDYKQLLSGAHWDVGQFAPKDLIRVQRLVLGRGYRVQHVLTEEIASLLPLLPNLEELFLEEWDQSSLDAWIHHADKQAGVALQKGGENRDESGMVEEAWECFAVEANDAIGQLYRSEYGDKPPERVHTHLCLSSGWLDTPRQHNLRKTCPLSPYALHLWASAVSAPDRLRKRLPLAPLEDSQDQTCTHMFVYSGSASD